MEKTTNIGLEEIMKHASPNQRYNNELLLVRLGGIDMRETNMEILPVQLEGLSIILIAKGESTITIDYVPYHLKKGMVLELMERNTIQNFNTSQDLEGFHLIASKDFLISLLRECGPPPPSVINRRRLNPTLQLEDVEFRLLTSIIEKLEANIARNDHYYQRSLIANDIRYLMMELWNIEIKKYRGIEQDIELGRHEELLMNFFKLIVQHCKEKHDVSFYSTELCVTPVYLSRTAKMLSGKTAIKWISDALIIEAKLMLRNPATTIQKVAEELNFSDQSSFGKFFKKHVGTSPIEYKQSIINGSDAQ